jgi:hypothetical protein
MSKTLNMGTKHSINVNYALERQLTMAKRNAVEITLPHNVTVKVDKLEGRTLRTVKVGDYLPASLPVRGTLCYFYARVTEVVGNTVNLVFGSTDRAHDLVFNKGDKVDVYRPL